MIPRQITGAIIAAVGLVLLFVTGVAFDLFGQKIDFHNNPAMYAFFGSIFLGAFGAGMIVMPPRLSFVAMVCLSGIFLALFIAGKLARGEL